MITSIRKFFQSKIGGAIFLAFLALVALAFAGADISGTSIGGLGSGERVAVVGDDEVSASELEALTQATLRRIRASDPTLTPQEFVAEGAVDEVLRQLTDRYAVAGFARETGLRGGENLVNSEILKDTQFRGLDGNFDKAIYDNFLREVRISDAIYRQDLETRVLTRQLLEPAISAPSLPAKAAKRYAALLFEQRSGQIALIRSDLYTPEGEPDDITLEAYYNDNRVDYVQPERRTLRFAVIDQSKITQDITPTPEEVAAFYQENKDGYAARETRDVTFFRVATQEGATALAEQISAGKSIQAAARDAGFETQQVTDLEREAMASATSFAAAQAIFATGEGDVAPPAESDLGWVVAQVTKVTSVPERSLEDVRPAIVEGLTIQKRADALGALTESVEAAVDGGTSLTQVAEEFGLTLEESPSLLADGRVFGNPLAQPNPAIRPILDTAFGLEESQPQLDVLVPGVQFLVYDVTSITESAASPLSEVREQVIADYQRSEANKVAKEAAQRVLESARGDQTLAAALRAEDKPIGAPDDVTLARAQLQQLAQQQGGVPPALALMFSMAKGTVKLLEAPANQGWILVKLDDISSQDIPEDSPVIAQAQAQFANVLELEYQEQLAKAMREEVGVEINDDVLEALKSKISGNL